MLAPLPAGTFVRVSRTRDPWLRRYSGLRARVEEDNGLIAEVMLPGGDLVSLWSYEVEPLASQMRGRVVERSEDAAPQGLRTRHHLAPGFLLQSERRRAGLTQMAIAAAMGVSVPRISQIESLPRVRTATAMRYLSALRAATTSAA